MSAIEQVRAVCLALPDVSERASHGRPAFFRGKRQFVHYMDRHHGDEHETLWCAAPEGMQQALVEGEPDHYFRPPYVGHRGWIGVRLDTGLAWDNVAAAIEDAYDRVGPG
ncbi:MAG: hypothetical protein JWM71_2339 [Solirubrobacteraceae bacterium]|nr:hypothetical protein [Solirubrobacteraceae bacterium]